MKFKLKNLSSGETANSEEMQENMSFALLRSSVLLMGPLGSQESRMNLTGENTGGKRPGKGITAFSAAPLPLPLGQAAFCPLQPTS